MQETAPIVEINGRRLADYIQMSIETGNDLYTCILVELDKKERAFMPITVSQMAANEKSLAATIDGETLNLVYFPGKVTTKLLSIFDSGLDGMNQALSEIIKSWDVQVSLEDSSFYPLDAESLAALGIEFLRSVAWAILEDIRPN